MMSGEERHMIHVHHALPMILESQRQTDQETYSEDWDSIKRVCKVVRYTVAHSYILSSGSMLM